MLLKLSDPEIPAEVKRASKLIITYAVVVMLGALWHGFSSDFVDSKGFIRAIFRFIGMSYIGWWVLSMDKKAWWFGIISCAVLLVFGIVGIGFLLFADVTHDSKFLWLVVNVFFSVYLLGHAVLILIRGSTRNHFAYKH
ncbi:MAG: hypothetical protein VR64_13175 [Desulfatitalea sp. BRH_c12]|nr:MAG: hypothetical protein VR64_13175 [Desulfatitalea sp. BRH_c12]